MHRSRLFTRREMLQTSAVAAALPLAARALGPAALQGPRTVKHDDPWLGLKMGVATYSLRKLPLDAAIKAVNRLGVSYVSIKDFHAPLKSTPDELRAIAQKFKDAGITPLSAGNITMNDEAAARQAFEYARHLGLPTIVCSPDPALLPTLDKLVKEFDIKLAIHNHGPEDKRFPAPADVWKAVEKYDRRIGLCIDVGHTARAQEDPAEAIVKYRARLYDLHIKDITDASRIPKNPPTELGRGVLDLKSILAALLKINYAHLVGLEYEKDADDPVPGMAESFGYLKGLLAGMKREGSRA